MEVALRKLVSVLPFLFGIGFIAPLIAQLMARFDVGAPFGLSPIVFGLAIGAAWGLYATVRGRWL